MAYGLDDVAGVTAVFTNHILWLELHNKALLGQGTVQHSLSPRG